MRNNFDLSPYRRSTVGFDRLFNLMEANQKEDDAYPPFDIVLDADDRFRITLAVAGFRSDEIEIVAHQNQLVVTGTKAGQNDNDDRRYLHRGIVTRSFERRFQLADFIEVGSAPLIMGFSLLSCSGSFPKR